MGHTRPVFVFFHSISVISDIYFLLYDNGEILTSILVNGANLFKINLQGIHILLPGILNALDAVFKLKYGKKESKERM